MQFHYLLMLVVCAAVVQGKKYCNSDDDCTELGDLFCMKSQCALGVCGCPRGEAAVFLGSKNTYSCVKLRRVGESCSEDGDGDMCGAEDSFCEEGKCTCRATLVPLRNGELCGSPSTRYPGETCSPSQGNNCDSSTCRSDTLGTSWYSPVRYNVPTCACLNTQTLTITNKYTTDQFAASAYPQCVSKKIGDSCLSNTDCGLIGTVPGRAQCTNNVCTCPGTFPYTDYDRSSCSTTRLPIDADCSSGDNCDGDEGLVCGDVCIIDEATPKCTCGPQHTRSGDTCKPISLGDPCHGDYNCKGFSDTGICVDGTCKNAGLQLSASIGGVLTMLAFALLHNLTL